MKLKITIKTKSKVISTLFLFLSIFVYGQRPFITLWNTNAKNDNSRQIEFESDYSSFSYSYININNPIINGTGSKDNLTHHVKIAFPEKGVYRVSIIPQSTFNFKQIFEGEQALKLIELIQWGDINWKPELIGMFSGCKNLKITANDIPDFSKSTTMAGMFASCITLDEIPNIEYWKTSNVTDMGQMFMYVTNFNQSIGNWDTSKVTNMSGMFFGSKSFNKSISEWNTSKVTDMSQMFFDAENFNQPIGNWNTSNVTTMSSMFRNARNFNQPISSWNISNIKWGIDYMFSGASQFNQPIGNWDVSNVVNMGYILDGAISFNQNLGDWNLKSIYGFNYSVDNLLNRTAMSCENYTKTLKGWAENPDTSKQFVTLGAEGLVYGPAGDVYRNYLMNEKKWKFNSDIFDSTCNPLIATSETLLSNILIYPNPFTDSFKIKSDNRFKDIDVKIFTMEGKLVFKKSYHSTEELEIYLNKGLTTGIYNLILSSKNILQSYKIIKK